MLCLVKRKKRPNDHRSLHLLRLNSSLYIWYLMRIHFEEYWEMNGKWDNLEEAMPKSQIEAEILNSGLDKPFDLGNGKMIPLVCKSCTLDNGKWCKVSPDVVCPKAEDPDIVACAYMDLIPVVDNGVHVQMGCNYMCHDTKTGAIRVVEKAGWDAYQLAMANTLQAAFRLHALSPFNEWTPLAISNILTHIGMTHG